MGGETQAKWRRDPPLPLREPRLYSDAYYSVWLYVPRQYTVNVQWWNVFQWKSKSPSANEPFWVVDVLNRPDGSMYLSLYDGRTRIRYEQGLMNLPVKRWFHVQAFLRASANGRGRIVVWQDGVKLWDIRNITTKFQDGDQQWSVNKYSDDVKPQPTVISADDARIERGPAP